MASITYWHRIEVRPRSTNIAGALSARVRDPLWMLTRQWQFGEFRGEDAASPAYVQVAVSNGRMLGWQKDATTFHSVPHGSPLEPVIQAESFSPDLSSRIEVGQLFETLLSEAGVPELIGDFRREYRIAALSDADFTASVDRETARFRQVVAGRALDGIAVYEAALAAAPDLPAAPAIDPAKEEAVTTVLVRLRAWVDEVWGRFGDTDSPAWNPERLEYRASAAAAAPANEPVGIDLLPGSDGDFAWQSLDIAAADPAGVIVPADAVQTFTRSVVPAHVRFRGMPNHRWWDFENGQMDFGSLTPDKRDLAKLVVMDFMLVAGNDWFLVPLALETGSLCRIDSLVVHDVFGGATALERADTAMGPTGQRCTFFSTSAREQVADFFVLPSNVGSTALAGRIVEDVHFLRDDMANMAWAVEVTTENGLGAPWPGHERDIAMTAPAAAEPAVPPTDTTPAPPLRYRLQSRVPENWIPLVPVAIDPAEGDIALERGAMLRDLPQPTPIPPAGRILQPSSLIGQPYRIREEEVPREGVRIARVVCRVRANDGATHLWIARRKQVGRGEGASGLRFDFTVEG